MLSALSVLSKIIIYNAGLSVNMDSLIDAVFNLNQDSDQSLRAILNQRGFHKIHCGQVSARSFKFDDSGIYPDQLVIVGYDKDLDLSFEQLLESYPHKKDGESVSIYASSIDDAVTFLGPRVHKVQTSGGEIYVPSVNPLTKFAALPLERKEISLAISIVRELTLPLELLDQAYFPSTTNPIFTSSLMVYAMSNGEGHTGEITTPIAMYTGKGKTSTEYAIALSDIKAAVMAQRDYIRDNTGDRSLLKILNSAKVFVNNYGKILPLF